MTNPTNVSEMDELFNEVEIDEEDPTKARAWAHLLMQNEGERTTKLGENFLFLLDNVDKWEDGSLSPDDWPNFTADMNLTTDFAIKLGTKWNRALPDSYAVTDNEFRFYGLYTNQENAEARAEEVDGDVETVTLESRADEWLDNFDRYDEGSSGAVIGENLRFLNQHTDNINPELVDEMPIANADVAAAMLYGALFGELWELSYPSLYAVFHDEDFVDVVHGSYKGEYLNDEYTLERIGVEDGETTTKEIRGNTDPIA